MPNYNERQLNNGEQGEGSGLNADKVDNSEGSELGNTIDGSTITENAEGEIQTTETFYVIGDFEQDFGEWTKTASGLNTSNITRENTSLKGNYSVKFYKGNTEPTGSYSIKNVVEKKADVLQVPFYPLDSDKDFVLEIYVDGTQEASITLDTPETGVWNYLNTDISSYSGNIDVEIKLNINTNYYLTAVFVDRIAFKSTDATNIKINNAEADN